MVAADDAAPLPRLVKYSVRRVGSYLHFFLLASLFRRDSNVSMVVEVELFLEPYQQLLRRTFFWRKLARAPNATWLTTQFREAAIQ